MNKTPGSIIEGTLSAQGLRIGIVCGRFNHFFVDRLLEGAMDSFCRSGGIAENVTVAWVPGCFEIPAVAGRFVRSGKFDAVVALAAVIQGSTRHAGHINSSVASALCSLSAESGVPVVHGVVATESLDQATERSGSKLGNRGASAISTAVEMANVMRAIDPVLA